MKTIYFYIISQYLNRRIGKQFHLFCAYLMLDGWLKKMLKIIPAEAVKPWARALLRVRSIVRHGQGPVVVFILILNELNFATSSRITTYCVILILLLI